MTILNIKKPKNTKLLGSVLFVVLISSLSMMQPLSYATSQQNLSVPSVDSACTDKIANAMHSKASQLDTSKAISLASNHKEFKSSTQNFITTYNSMYNTWDIDNSNCDVTLKTMNVVYSLNDTKGYVKNVVVTLDPALTKVIGESEHVGGHYTSPNWSGYELAGNSGASVAVYEAKATYTLPSASTPTSAHGGNCSSKPCDLAIWPGLEDQTGAGNTHLVQAGSDEKITCTNCTPSIFFWYQFSSTGTASQCGGITINAGDSITIDVVNEAKNGGSNTKYDVSMQDTTSGGGCSITGQTYTAMNSPKYADFIDERATYSGFSTSTLAKFGSDTMTGTMYYSSASHPISTTGATYVQDIMNNGYTDNISVSNISSGQFTQTYQNSDGT